MTVDAVQSVTEFYYALPSSSGGNMLRFSHHAIMILTIWLIKSKSLNNFRRLVLDARNPYPSEVQKRVLAEAAGVNSDQLDKWLFNSRPILLEKISTGSNENPAENCKSNSFKVVDKYMDADKLQKLEEYSKNHLSEIQYRLLEPIELNNEVCIFFIIFEFNFIVI